MIPFQDMVKKYGKSKAVEMAVHSQRGETGAQKARKVRFGTNLKHKLCEHGIWIVENYKVRACHQCEIGRQTKLNDFKPYFNIGLGGLVESRSDEKRSAKALGLVEAG